MIKHRTTTSKDLPARGIAQHWRRASAAFGKARLSISAPVGSAPREQFDPSRPLVFLHIPKTAGTSLVAALIDTLHPRTVIGGFDRVLFGDYDDFTSFDEALRREVHLSPDTLAAADLISGHIAYSSLRQRFPGAQFVTVLREPISRLLSHWLYWRGQSDEELAPWGPWADRVRLSRMPLTAFLSSRLLACQLDNLVIRMLLWPHRLIPIDDFIDRRHDRRLLAEARERLAGFTIVDVVETPELPDRLQRWLGCPFVLDRRNETGSIPESLRRPLAMEMAPKARELLTMHTRLDLELWNEVTSRYHPDRDPAQLRVQSLLWNVARYAVLMAASSAGM